MLLSLPEKEVQANFNSTDYVLTSLTGIRSGFASRDILLHAWETVSTA